MRVKNKRLLDFTFLHNTEGDDENLEGTPLSLQERKEAANFLLDMDTGDWSSDSIVHHCGIGCCTSELESKLKLWVAIQASWLDLTMLFLSV